MAISEESRGDKQRYQPSLQATANVLPMQYFVTGPSKFISSLSFQDIKAITVLTALDITEPCMISQKKKNFFLLIVTFLSLNFC